MAGCAEFRNVDPGRVTVEVEAPSVACGAGIEELPVVLRVRNESLGLLRLWVDGPSGPPYRISWLSYEVETQPALPGDWRLGPGDHGPMPPSTLRIGPGDGTTVSVDLYDIRSEDFARDFRIRLESNDDDLVWMTDAFRPCVAAAP